MWGGWRFEPNRSQQQLSKCIPGDTKRFVCLFVCLFPPRLTPLEPIAQRLLRPAGRAALLLLPPPRPTTSMTAPFPRSPSSLPSPNSLPGRRRGEGEEGRGSPHRRGRSRCSPRLCSTFPAGRAGGSDQGRKEGRRTREASCSRHPTFVSSDLDLCGSNIRGNRASRSSGRRPPLSSGPGDQSLVTSFQLPHPPSLSTAHHHRSWTLRS